MPEFSAIIFCPLCCSTIDVVESGQQSHECVSCGTEFTVNLDPDKVAEHSLVG